MKIILIDGKNSLYRMYHQPALKMLSTEDGFPTGAIFGCLQYSLLSLVTKYPDAAVVWCWDGQGETWRHKVMREMPSFDQARFIDAVEDNVDEEEIVSGASATMYENFATNMIKSSLGYMGVYNQPQKKKKKNVGYKANRPHHRVDAKKEKSKYPTDDRQRALIQIPVLKLILDGIGLRNFEIDNLECDDLIGILTKKALDMDCEVLIVSGDRDYYQLLTNENVRLIKGSKQGKLIIMKKDDVLMEHGLKAKHWAKYRALTGDSSDNIPHLWKVGPATAKKMLADGINPSEESHDHIELDIQSKYARYFQPYGIEKMWPAVHMNYKLCKLIMKTDDPLLSVDVQKGLEETIGYIKKEKHFCRKEECKNSDYYRRVSVLLSKYELTSILGRRDTLWEIP